MLSRLAIAPLAATLLLGACAYSPGGAGTSNDTFCYESTAHQPTTVSVVDTRSGENVLTVEIPVGQQLVLSFYGNDDDEARGKGDLKWGVMPVGRSHGGLSNSLSVPPHTARRIDVSHRRSPEYTRPLVKAKPSEVPSGVTVLGTPRTVPNPAEPAAPAPAPAPDAPAGEPPTDQPKVQLPE